MGLAKLYPPGEEGWDKSTYFLQRLEFRLDRIPKLSDLDRMLFPALDEEGSEGLELVEQGVAVV